MPSPRVSRVRRWYTVKMGRSPEKVEAARALLRGESPLLEKERARIRRLVRRTFFQGLPMSGIDTTLKQLRQARKDRNEIMHRLRKRYTRDSAADYQHFTRAVEALMDSRKQLFAIHSPIAMQAYAREVAAVYAFEMIRTPGMRGRIDEKKMQEWSNQLRVPPRKGDPYDQPDHIRTLQHDNRMLLRPLLGVLRTRLFLRYYYRLYQRMMAGEHSPIIP